MLDSLIRAIILNLTYLPAGVEFPLTRSGRTGHVYWLWQGVISNAVYSILSVVILTVIGIVIGWLNMAGNIYATPALYSLGAAALTGITLLTIRMLISVPIPQLQITPDNIEQNVRTWCDNFKLGTQKAIYQYAIWTIIVTLHNGRRVVVYRPKDPDRYLFLETAVTLTGEHADLYKRLDEKEREHFLAAMVLEIARTGSLFEWKDNDISLSIRIPITSNLSESEFIAHIEQMSKATIVTVSAVKLQMESAKINKP